MKIIMFNRTTTLVFFLFGTLVTVTMLLQGCASSAASRGAAGEADQAYLQTDYALRHLSDGDGLRDAYQNSSQLTKGILIGGVVGAAAGSATSAVGGAAGFGLGAIFGGAIGSYIDSHATLADRLENRQVRVITLGDQIMMVVNSSIIFKENSSHLRAESYETLDMIVDYIARNPNMSVKVAAYTSAAIPDSVARRLTQQQAESVTRYFWGRRINTRLLYAEGGGGSKLVTANIANWSSDNYRVEITLEKLPV